MSKATTSARVHGAEKRYLLQAKNFQGWWPWGVLRIACLVLLYVYGTTLVAPQAYSKVRSGFLDRADGAEPPQNMHHHTTMGAKTGAGLASEVDGSANLQESDETTGLQEIEKVQR